MTAIAATPATRRPAAERPLTVVDASRPRALARLGELRRARELVALLVWREVKVRYKQTAVGAAWALLQPLLLVALFSVVFGRLAGLDTGGVPYPAYVAAAFLPWLFFAAALNGSSASLVVNKELITKVYFPRIAVPVATVLAPLLDLALGSLLVAGLLGWYGLLPGPEALAVPGLVALAVAAALGVGAWLSALNVQYRDVQHAVPFLTQLWFFATPIAYPASVIPEGWRLAFAANPLTGVVEGIRWALFGAGPFPAATVAISAGVALLLLVTGVLYFWRTERTFADLV